MPIFLLVLFLTVSTLPALAVDRVTAEQLEQFLVNAHGKPDARLAQQLSSMQLTERLSDARLSRLEVETPGPESRQSLILLADVSGFLDPPPAEIPDIATPTLAAQRQIITLAADFAKKTISGLPNFYATRVTTRYEDSPGDPLGLSPVAYLPLRRVDSSKDTVLYRDGHEVDMSAAGDKKSRLAAKGLTTSGLFGPILATVLVDIAQGDLAWSHWEKGSDGIEAVFRYKISKEKSHYGVEAFNASRKYPAYHGVMAVDPTNGAILRLTAEADLKPQDPIARSSILLEYGGAEIGGKIYICPLKSVSIVLSRGAYFAPPGSRNAQFRVFPDQSAPGPLSTSLNVITFEQYHMFRAEARLKSEETSGKPPACGSIGPENSPALIDDSIDTVIAESGSQPDNASSTGAMPSVQTLPPVNETTAAAPAPEAKEPQAAPVNINVNVNRVLVPVVVRDNHGRVVNDLKEEDFQVFDNEKLRVLSGFVVQKRGTVEDTKSGKEPPAPLRMALPSPAAPRRFIVFLFDDMHLSPDELVRTQRAGIKAVGALGDSDIAAVVSTSGRTNSGLIRDRAKLQDAIMGVHPRVLQGLNECPNIEYFQADLMLNRHDSGATEEAVEQTKNCPGLGPRVPLAVIVNLAQSAAMRALTAGRRNLEVTYSTIADLVLKMGKLPGERTMILASPGFLPIEPQVMAAESHIIDLAAQSNVTISALDARGVYTAELNAAEYIDMGTSRYQTDIRRQSMSRAEDAMGELADGTGGTFFHNSNDLDAGFTRLTEIPDCVYLLELSLDNVEPDGAYHRLKVKVDRDALHLQARRGYVAPEAGKNKN